MASTMRQYSDDQSSIARRSRYTIRYCRRRDEGLAALLVADDDATTYLFSDGILQLRFAGEEAEQHLQCLLADHPVWSPFPDGQSRTLDELRALIA